MADNADYSDPTQATEARLCAYLEGTLPDADRAEIEAYLAKSPDHRKLLHDLATMRAWVTELPRVPAPPDILDSFESQVERKMLLDDSTSAVSLRLNRGPQVALSAAIVLLVLGLGAILYLALNVRGPSAQRYVASVPATKPVAAPAAPQQLNGLSDARDAAPPPGPMADGAFSAKALVTPTPRTLESAKADEPRAQSAAVKDPSRRADVAALPPVMPEPQMTRSATTTTAPAFTFPKVVVTPLPPGTQPVVVAAGDRLSVDIPQLVGPGVEKTTRVRVDKDGTIALPMLDPMPAAGRSPAALQKQIADRYTQEHLLIKPVVTVLVLPPPQPTTAPATQPAASQPTTRPVAATQPATRPQR